MDAPAGPVVAADGRKDANDVTDIAPILEIGPLTREVTENVNPDVDGPYVERVAAYAGFSIAP
jgi:hypothetical protein